MIVPSGAELFPINQYHSFIQSLIKVATISVAEDFLTD